MERRAEGMKLPAQSGRETRGSARDAAGVGIDDETQLRAVCETGARFSIRSSLVPVDRVRVRIRICEGEKTIREGFRC
jgi:hypothetical protein